ncbi:MAG: RluA family pseudouridine synthase [Proteobacteria bacterium]|nr:RluA family pseudouridine synthase [Pseudomonadota bacterium]
MVDKQGAFKIVANDNDYGKRLDYFLKEAIDQGQRSRIVDLVKQKSIFVNGSSKKPSYKLKPGDIVTGDIPPIEHIPFEPEDISLDILFEDKDMVVINKQAGLVVHPAPGNWTGTLVNGLLYHYPGIQSCDDEIRPGIVHRLDRDTSGVMVVAKNRDALFKLSELFRTREVTKRYLAIVHGVVKQDASIIDLSIGRHPVDRKKMSTMSPRGKKAETHFRVEKRYPHATVLQCEIKTGRTHQIRVHCQSMNHPLVGDKIYIGGKRVVKKGEISPWERTLNDVKRQMLHSFFLKFTHPVTGKNVEFQAPLPQDMLALINELELSIAADIPAS